MEVAQNRPPVKVSEGAEAKCNHCGAVIYQEFIITQIVDGAVQSHKEVSGSYRFKCDEHGNQVGPVIPFCKCKEVYFA